MFLNFVTGYFKLIDRKRLAITEIRVVVIGPKLRNAQKNS